MCRRCVSHQKPNCAISPQFGSKMSEMQIASEKGLSIPTREKPHPWSRESPMSHKSDIEIAREANKKPIQEIGEKLGIPTEHLLPYGHDKAKVGQEFINS